MPTTANTSRLATAAGKTRPKCLPECPVANPLLKGYPFGYLCGAGVAFKLSCALLGWETASRFLDLAALATVADICKGFGMHILAYDKYPAPGSSLTYAELPELLRQADVISLHCPLTDETRHMIDADAIASMKPGAVLINTSRGALVDTEALIEGLRSRKVGAACLDVYEEEADLFYEDRSESIIEDDTLVRLISMPNVIVTSHQAFLTKEALNNIAAATVENLLKFERGEPSPETEVCYRGAQ